MAGKQTGLNSAQVEQSRQQHGVNVITPAKKELVWKLFLSKFNDPIIKILLVAAVLSFLVSFSEGGFAEMIGIVCAVLLATGISFWFEYDAKRRFEILNVVNDDTPVKVIRDSHVDEVAKRDIVVGDIVVLATGDEVPADGRLLEAISMKVNESSLTGEPLTAKTTDTASGKGGEHTYPVDMALRGSTVAEGHGIMEVTAVGDATEYGKVAEQSTVDSGEKTPLDKQLERLSSIISKVGAGLAIIVFAILLGKDLVGGGFAGLDTLGILGRLLNYFMVSVVIMVMAVPEGLPMSITLSLAMSMRRMLKTNNLVRKMHACETMGAVTVICTDKTGTLTRNQMRVAGIEDYADLPERDIFGMMAVNSTAFLDDEGKVIGNPTEGALLLWMQQRGGDYENLREQARIVDQISFSTKHKYMATLVRTQGGNNILYVKGAPEIVIGMCRTDGSEAEIDRRLSAYQNKAMRTLALAFVTTERTSCKEAIADGDLELAAIVAIADPVRDDVPAAVRECLDAGIRIKIVTGDTPATAREIARQIGLWNDQTDTKINEITGPEFAGMSDQALLEILPGLKIMARARPLDKQRLVKLLQSQGEVVAVTGDGTNDAPALNFAQVGLSMGSGTSVAKEASDITLLDDSFSSIATAVMWGRSLYRNIQRFVLFQLTVNFVALVVVFFGSVFGDQLPLTVTQILWVNIIMDTFAALALASLPPEPQVMEEKPRRQEDFIITRPILQRIVGIGTLMAVTLLGMLIGWGKEISTYHLTVFFSVFVMFQFWNLFNAKAFGTSCGVYKGIAHSAGFLGILAAILAGQILIVSFGGEVFRTVPLSLTTWLWVIGGTALMMVGGELFRAVTRRRKCSRSVRAARFEQ